MAKSLVEKMDLWLNCNYNVLLEGKHGVGKTHLITQAFESKGLNYRYFSASTMDPWVDFIGVPKEQTREDGTSYLGLVRPEDFEDDKVEAIFFDEFNRAPAKVRNGVMELLQFKSINGRKFKNLKVIWTAINPADEDDTYDVDDLDPAQRDRFQIQVTIPYKPDVKYFLDKYGSIGQTACEWWDSLPTEHRDLVSPRRLDYAVNAYNNGLDLMDVLNKEVRPKTLKSMIEQVGTDLTFDEQWQMDPELFINTLANRNDKTDVVEAFVSLKNICYDMAVEYVSKLPPAKMKKIAVDSRTIDIVFGVKPSKSVTTSLKPAGLSPSQVSNNLQLNLQELQTTSPEILNLILQTDQDKLCVEPWDALMANLQRGVDEYAAYGIMAAAIARIQDKNETTWRRGNRLVVVILKAINYLFDFYRNINPDILRINPVLTHKVIHFVRDELS